jgi:putative transposase
VEDAHRRQIALFRHALVRQAADVGLSSAERGRLVRDLAARDHAGPDGAGCGWAVRRWIVGYGRIGRVGSTRLSRPREPADR